MGPLAAAADACPLALDVFDVLGAGGSSSESKHESYLGALRENWLPRQQQVQLSGWIRQSSLEHALALSEERQTQDKVRLRRVVRLVTRSGSNFGTRVTV